MASSFRCPRCGQLLPPATSAAGSAQVTCSACQATLYVPTIATSGETEKRKSTFSASEAVGEFRVQCEKCGKSIRVPAHLAGRNGACPQCKQTFRIPELTTTAADHDRVIVSLPESDPPRTETPATPISTPYPLPSTTPYSTPVFVPHPVPTDTPQPSPGPGPTYLTPSAWQLPSHSAGVVRKPRGESPNVSFITITKVCGVIMMVLAGINTLIFVLSLFVLALGGLNKPSVTPAQLTRNRVTVTTFHFNSTSVAVVVLTGLATVGVLGGMMYGGHQMFLLQSWAWALAASILSIVPCVVFTSVIGIPVGIVGIVMLSNPAVRSQFESIR